MCIVAGQQHDLGAVAGRAVARSTKRIGAGAGEEGVEEGVAGLGGELAWGHLQIGSEDGVETQRRINRSVGGSSSG